MNSLDSMTKKLENTKIYAVKPGGRNYAEIKAFSVGLDMIFNELDEMLREYYIDTAQSYGLTERERFTGAVRDDLSIEKRRELLKTREQTNEKFCTPEAFNKILQGYGLGGFELIENPQKNALTVKIYDALDEQNKAWVNKMIDTNSFGVPSAQYSIHG